MYKVLKNYKCMIFQLSIKERRLTHEKVMALILGLRVSGITSFILYIKIQFNPLSANPTKWSNTLKQFIDNLPIICLSVFDNFVGLALKGLKSSWFSEINYLFTRFKLLL